MDIVTLAQVVTSVTNLLFVIVLAAGYYFTWRVSQTTLEEMRAQRTAMGRPLVIVQEDYESLPELDVAIRNVSEGAARDIEFEFSVPIESSNGFVVSDLPYFKYGLDFLPPNGEITCYWDELDSLLPFLESKDLRSGIHVTVRYKDLSGDSVPESLEAQPVPLQRHPPRKAQGHGRPRERRRETGTEQRREFKPGSCPGADLRPGKKLTS